MFVCQKLEISFQSQVRHFSFFSRGKARLEHPLRLRMQRTRACAVSTRRSSSSSAVSGAYRPARAAVATSNELEVQIELSFVWFEAQQKQSLIEQPQYLHAHSSDRLDLASALQGLLVVNANDDRKRLHGVNSSVGMKWS